jgi:hypothetical protein
VSELAVIIGTIGKLPYAGMSLYWGHHIIGLHELGYDVHYAERVNAPLECHDPVRDVMTDDPSFAVSYLEEVLPRFGVQREQASFIDIEGNCHLSGWPTLISALERAAFVLVIGDPTWFAELELCANRAFVDCDPVFTQVSLATGDGIRGEAAARYTTLFTYGARIGAADCTIPDVGRTWIPARPVVATSAWSAQPPSSAAPVAALLHWAAGSDLEYDGLVYGHKNRQFQQYLELPHLREGRFVLALGGHAPRADLARAGWELVNPMEMTGTIPRYERFIADSRADLGISKHAYVVSRCGWFSDRSTCYLAAGRPVLHEDTGFTDWLPAGDGVLAFSGLDGLLQALERLDADYEHHARAARRMAEEHFEARVVIGQMLDEAGFR